MTFHRFAVVLFVLWFAAAGAETAGGGPYFYDLGNNQGGTESEAFAVNNGGMAVGCASTAAGAIGYANATGFTYSTGGGMIGQAAQTGSW